MVDDPHENCKEETMKFTERELKERYADLENAIASQRLEGLEPDPRTIEDMECVVRGEFDTEEALRRLRERITLAHTS
jgi:hypothetical protein